MLPSERAWHLRCKKPPRHASWQCRSAAAPVTEVPFADASCRRQAVHTVAANFGRECARGADDRVCPDPHGQRHQVGCRPGERISASPELLIQMCCAIYLPDMRLVEHTLMGTACSRAYVVSLLHDKHQLNIKRGSATGGQTTTQPACCIAASMPASSYLQPCKWRECRGTTWTAPQSSGRAVQQHHATAKMSAGELTPRVCGRQDQSYTILAALTAGGARAGGHAGEPEEWDRTTWRPKHLLPD